MASRTLKKPIEGPPSEICLELEDYGMARRSAVEFFGVKNVRDPQPLAARLAEQFVDRNRTLMAEMNVLVFRDYDGRDVSLRLQAGSAVGAIPLYSPTSARPDYGLVVQPRFPWMGIGPMLAEMGWRVAPSPLRLPLLRRSERRVPSWVLSSMILVRMQALLQNLDRRFEIVGEDRTAPRGRVDWVQYATRLSRAQPLSIPCTYPDLRKDRQLRGAIRFTLEKQIQSLETQKEHGGFVHQLVEFGRQLWQEVRTVPIQVPSSFLMNAWLQRPMQTQSYVDGVQGIEWTAEDRGLAGISDLEGIPRRMPMETFFEAWVETVLMEVARKTGGLLRAGRKRETVHAVHWQPPYAGSQRALIPDFSIQYADTTVIVDAKYKRHWEELQRGSWGEMMEELREQHRQDLLQVLAYGNLATTPNVVVCLAYPCTAKSWESLRERGRLHHQAEVAVGSRTVRLWLTAVPMAMSATTVAESLTAAVRAMVRISEATWQSGRAVGGPGSGGR